MVRSEGVERSGNGNKETEDRNEEERNGKLGKRGSKV